MSNKVDSLQLQVLHDEIQELERQLKDAKARLNTGYGDGGMIVTPPSKIIPSHGKILIDISTRISL
jgi:hypothetical protein